MEKKIAEQRNIKQLIIYLDKADKELLKELVDYGVIDNYNTFFRDYFYSRKKELVTELKQKLLEKVNKYDTEEEKEEGNE